MKLNKLLAAIGCIILLFAQCMTAFAETPDVGSIKIHLTDGKSGTSKENVQFSCYKIADVEDGIYVLNKQYEKTEVDLNNLKSSKDLELAAKKLSKSVSKSDAKTVATDKDGDAVLQDLEIGVYLLIGQNSAKYDNITPTIIAIPTLDEKSDGMIYDITVVPKHSPKPNPKWAPQTNVNQAKFKTYLMYAGISGLTLCTLICIGLGKKQKKNRN